MTISNNDCLKILIVSAEESSAMYATRLLRHWKSQGKNVNAFGVGSESMAKEGFRIVGRAEDLAVMGLQEIVSHWGLIKKTFYQLIEEAQEQKPDVILLMDYPEFNLRLAKKLKQLGFPIVYYISPQIWAWRTYRVHKIKKIVDLMLVIFPFEKEFYASYQVPVEFVGHPLLDVLDELLPTPEQIAGSREKLLTGERNHILALMPGSRKSEIKYNLKTQIEVAEKISNENSKIQPVLFIAPSLDENFVKELCAQYGYKGAFLKEDPFYMISVADTVLCASGTATLMVGLCEKPMVIMYKMNSLTAFFAKKLVRHVPYFGMVNLVSQDEIVPERFQEDANVEELTKLLQDIINDSNGRRSNILKALKNLKSRLGAKGGISTLALKISQFVEGRKQ